MESGAPLDCIGTGKSAGSNTVVAQSGSRLAVVLADGTPLSR